MFVDKALVMLKICSTSITFFSLRDLKAAPEETMQLRRLIKSSNGPDMFRKIKVLEFVGPQS